MRTFIFGVVLAASPLAARADSLDERSAALTYYLSFRDCVSATAISYGAFNRREPEAVAREALPRCDAQWRQFHDAMLDGVTSTLHDQQELQRWRSEAALAAVIEINAERRRLGKIPSKVRQ